MMPRAFVLEPTLVDVTCAENYGDLVLLFPNCVPRSRIWSGQFMKDVLAAFKKYAFDYEQDYFVIAGAMAPLTLTIAELVCAYPSINFLLHSTSDQAYIAVTTRKHDP